MSRIPHLVLASCSVALLLVLGGGPTASAEPGPSRLELLRAALLQIRNDWPGMVPPGTWAGWDGSAGGVTSGTIPGGTGNPADDTPWVKFDATQIYLPKDNSGTAVPDSAGVTYPGYPLKPDGDMYVSLSGAYVDENLLRIKTVLFHELCHVGQWRDTSGHWDLVGGAWTFSDPKDDDLKEIKEIEASARTLRFLQALLAKGEFPKKGIQEEIRREMENLQKNLRAAAEAARRIGATGWGVEVLRRWLPRDLLALILLKKLATLGWATAGPLTDPEVAHLHEVVGDLDDLDGRRDHTIRGEPLPGVLVGAIAGARALHELRGHRLVTAVRQFQRGHVEGALRTLAAYRHHLATHARKLGAEVVAHAQALVDLVVLFLEASEGPSPVVEFLTPPEMAPVHGVTLLSAADSSGLSVVASARFEVSEDGTSWVELGWDAEGADGWTLAWDASEHPVGPALLRVTLTTFGEGRDDALRPVVVVPGGPLGAAPVEGP